MIGPWYSIPSLESEPCDERECVPAALRLCPLSRSPCRLSPGCRSGRSWYRSSELDRERRGGVGARAEPPPDAPSPAAAASAALVPGLGVYLAFLNESAMS